MGDRTENMDTVLDGKYKTARAVIALGMFDGVHLGHRVLLQKAKSLALRAKAPLVVCTFASHPMTLIAPEKAPPLLTTFEERARLLEEMGTDVLYALPFDRTVMNQLPECYIGELVRRFHPTDVVCGYNHSFGKEGRGNPALLEAVGGALGFRTSVVPHITFRGQDVSSTAIRNLLACGEVLTARKMLLRPYERQVSLSCEKTGLCRVKFAQDAKQSVGAGRYRCLLLVDEKKFPVSVETDEKDNCVCRWALPRETEGRLRYFVNSPA